MEYSLEVAAAAAGPKRLKPKTAVAKAAGKLRRGTAHYSVLYTRSSNQRSSRAPVCNSAVSSRTANNFESAGQAAQSSARAERES